MLAAITSFTARLLTSGPVGGWAGILLFIAAGLWVLWQLRRDLANVKRTRLTRWGLGALRLAIVALIAWLLCQPILLIDRHWTPPPQIMLVIDSGNSMRVNEAGGSLARQLDALDAVGKQPIADRNSAASRIARACEGISRSASSTLAALHPDQEAALTGLPLGPSVAQKLDALAVDLHSGNNVLTAARAQLPAESADKDVKQSLMDLAGAAQVVGASAEGLIADAGVVGRESPKSPSLLDAYLVRLKKLVASTDSLGQGAMQVQEKLDQALLGPKELQAIRTTPLTRGSLADMAADRIATQDPSASVTQSWERTRSPTLARALDDAFRKSLISPVSGVVLLSDGSAPIPPANSSLDRLRLPVNTVLIGADGVEPADAGLIAIDVPRVALAGDAVNVRCLVKNLVSSTPPPKLTLTVGKDQVASRELAVSQNGYDLVELAWTPAAPGRFQLVFNIDTSQPDAYPGNESSAAIVDVISNKAHVLVVSDRLTNDFAAVSQALGAMPAVDAHVILAAPGLSRFKTGSKLEEFPATPEDFKALSLLVLIGDVPEAANEQVIQSLKSAIDAGLRVWVQSPATGRSVKSWTAALGIETKPIEQRQSIEPAGGLWLDLYEFGRETEESAARWKAFPRIGGLSEIVTPGVPLLTADGRPVLQLIPRKAGAAIACGISDFTALRNAATFSSVNRLLAESLSLGLTSITEPGQAAGLFPPQPILGHNIYLIGEGSPSSGLEPVVSATTNDGFKPFRVTDPHTIAVQIGGTSVPRVVRQLVAREDFQLAAHAAPLVKIATATAGRSRDLLSMSDVLPPGLAGTPRSSTTRILLWPGPWSLVVLLILVSAEYLLRRRAGKVM